MDYTSGPYLVMFPAGATSATFIISITDDNKLENDKNFMLTINSSSLPTGVSHSDLGQATVTIVDNACKLCHI